MIRRCRTLSEYTLSGIRAWHSKNVRPRLSFAKTAAMTFSAAIGLSMSACSSPFESWMSEGCDGLRQEASAFASGDRDQFDDATWGSFDPASEQAAGDEKGDVRVAFSAALALSGAAHGTPRSRAASDAWPSKQLTEEEQRQVEAGLAVCDDY